MGGFVLVRALRGSNALPRVVSSLLRMEFRGRDCSGVAWISGGELRVVKDRCPIAELSRRYNLDEVFALIALGHTRYSTHGKADQRNAHPHLDCRGLVAVVGDGALRNYEELQLELSERGHKLLSKSDFELIPHMVEELLDRGLGNIKALVDAAKRVRGMVSFAGLLRDGTAFAYTSHQPIFVGLSEDYIAISSTMSGLHGLAERFARVSGGEAVISTSGGELLFLDVEGGAVTKLFTDYGLEERLVATDGYENHMLREVYEVPYSILRTVSAVQARYLELASKIVLRSSRVFVIANGSSLHASMVFSYYLSELAKVVPLVVSASEFLLYQLDSVGVGDVVIAVSQSGETAEVVRSAYEARLRGATVIGLTNNINSRLTTFSNLYLPIAAGPEVAVPATKTFTSTLVLMYALAKAVSSIATTPSSKLLSNTWDEVERAHKILLERVASMDHEARRASEVIAGCSSGYVVSRGIAYPLALEGALKIKEAAYVHAEGVEGGELRHGPISILDRDKFVVFVEPLEPAAAEDTMRIAREVLGYGSPIVLVTHSGRVVEDLGANVRVPNLGRYFTPVGIAIALQLLAYWLARSKGVDVDRPRRLTKVVRIE